MLLCGLRSAASRMRQTVDRLAASAAYSLTRRAANSSKVQRVAGQPWPSGSSEARARTVARCWGGNVGRAARARSVLQAGQAAGSEAGAPQADGVSVAAYLGSDAPVGGMVGRGSPQDEPAAQGKGLGRRGGAGEDL